MEDTVEACFELDAACVGLAPPPFSADVRLDREANAWSVVLRPPEGEDRRVVDWLVVARPWRVEFAPGEVRVDFRPIPVAWAPLLQGPQLDALTLRPDGVLLVRARGERAVLRRLAAWKDAGVVRVAAPHEPPALLTRAQAEALRLAVRAGYYEMPRPLHLRDLAAGLHVKTAAFSERLRKAEGRVLTAYVNGGLEGPEPSAREPAVGSSLRSA